MVDQQVVYPQVGATTLLTAPVWSARGRNLAVIERPNKQGLARLVVLLRPGRGAEPLTWDLPKGVPAKALNIFWLGEGRVLIGTSLLEPSFSVEFSAEPELVSWAL